MWQTQNDCGDENTKRAQAVYTGSLYIYSEVVTNVKILLCDCSTCSTIIKHTRNTNIAQSYTRDDDSDNEMSIEILLGCVGIVRCVSRWNSLFVHFVDFKAP